MTANGGTNPFPIPLPRSEPQPHSDGGERRRVRTSVPDSRISTMTGSAIAGLVYAMHLLNLRELLHP
jgi:hypothetical protein